MKVGSNSCDSAVSSFDLNLPRPHPPAPECRAARQLPLPTLDWQYPLRLISVVFQDGLHDRESSERPVENMVTIGHVSAAQNGQGRHISASLDPSRRENLRRPNKFQHCEFRVMPGGQALIPEI